MEHFSVRKTARRAGERRRSRQISVLRLLSLGLVFPTRRAGGALLIWWGKFRETSGLGLFRA